MADHKQPDSPRPLLTATLPFGALTLASVIAILVAPEVESGRIFLSGFFAIFSTLVLYRTLDEGVQRGNVSRRLVAPALILNLIASGVLGYLAGSALMGLRT